MASRYRSSSMAWRHSALALCLAVAACGKKDDGGAASAPHAPVASCASRDKATGALRECAEYEGAGADGKALVLEQKKECEATDDGQEVVWAEKACPKERKVGGCLKENFQSVGDSRVKLVVWRYDGSEAEMRAFCDKRKDPFVTP